MLTLNKNHYLQEYPSLNKGHYHFQDNKKVLEFTKSKRSDPVTMLIIAGTALAVAGEVKKAQTEEGIEKFNARVAEARGVAIKRAGAFESEGLRKQSAFERARISREKSRALSEQRAKFAKAGVRLDVDTPLDVAADTAAEFELDIAANRFNESLSLERIRFDTEVGIARSQSETTFRNLLGKQKRQAGFIKAGSTLLTGGAGFAKFGGGVNTLGGGGGGIGAVGGGGGGIQRFN